MRTSQIQNSIAYFGKTELKPNLDEYLSELLHHKWIKSRKVR